MQIRPIQPADLETVQSMIADLARFHDDTASQLPATLAKDLFGPSPWFTILVAETKASALIGYVAMLPTGQLQFGVKGMDIHHIFVHQNARNSGVGRALIKACVAHAKSRACAFVTVGTHPENTPAGSFYEAQGFARRPQVGPRFSIRI